MEFVCDEGFVVCGIGAVSDDAMSNPIFSMHWVQASIDVRPLIAIRVPTFIAPQTSQSPILSPFVLTRRGLQFSVYVLFLRKCSSTMS